MKKLKTLAVLSFIALLSFGVASCFNPSGPGTGNGGGNGGDTIKHGKRTDTIPNHHDTIPNPHDTIHDTLIKPPPPPPPPPDSGGLDTNLLDSLLKHK